MLREYTIHLPVEDNEGENLAQEIINLKVRALADFGGYTFTACHKEGAWFDRASGTVYKDAVQVIQIAIEPEPKAQTNMGRYLEACKKDLRQEAIYYSFKDAHIL